MTTDEFKTEYPELSHLEGDELWDAMTHAMMRGQVADDIVRQTKPFFKRYKLRYLFYIKRKNLVFATPESSYKRCKSCKTGIGSMIFWGGKRLCLKCGNDLVEEPNTNLDHLLFKIKEKAKELAFGFLEVLHIAKYSNFGRYDMFGDESMFISKTRYSKDWEFMGHEFKSRKWWQYIFIPIR